MKSDEVGEACDEDEGEQFALIPVCFVEVGNVYRLALLLLMTVDLAEDEDEGAEEREIEG